MTDNHAPNPSGTVHRSFAARVATVLLLVSLFTALAITLSMAAEVLLLFFAGVLLAVVLRAASDPISQWTGIGAKWSLSLVIVFLLAATVGIGWMAAPTVAEQFGNLRQNLGESVGTLTERIEETTAGEVVSNRAQAVRERLTAGEGMWDRVAGIFSSTFGALSGLVILLVVGLFMAYSPDLYIGGIMRLIPLEKRHRSCEVITALGATLRGWLVGQIISMLFLFFTTWIMLSLLGVPLAFILSLLTGIFTFVPYIGPIMALVPILLVAFMEDPMLAVYTGALFMVVQNVEGSVLMPLIFQKTIALPPGPNHRRPADPGGYLRGSRLHTCHSSDSGCAGAGTEALCRGCPRRFHGKRRGGNATTTGVEEVPCSGLKAVCSAGSVLPLRPML